MDPMPERPLPPESLAAFKLGSAAFVTRRGPSVLTSSASLIPSIPPAARPLRIVYGSVVDHQVLDRLLISGLSILLFRTDVHMTEPILTREGLQSSGVFGALHEPCTHARVVRSSVQGQCPCWRP